MPSQHRCLEETTPGKVSHPTWQRSVSCSRPPGAPGLPLLRRAEADFESRVSRDQVNGRRHSTCPSGKSEADSWGNVVSRQGDCSGQWGYASPQHAVSTSSSSNEQNGSERATGPSSLCSACEAAALSQRDAQTTASKRERQTLPRSLPTTRLPRDPVFLALQPSATSGPHT